MAAHDSGFEIDQPPALADEGLKALYRYWRELGQAASGLPSVTSFDPLHLPKLLPNIWIIEVAADTHRLRMRLAGESINAIYGRNIGGHYFADVFPSSDLESLVARYSRALGEPAVFHTTGEVYAAAGRMTQGERLGLPMLGRSGTTDTMLGATIYGVAIERGAAPKAAREVVHFHPIRAANHRPTKIAGA